MLPTRPVEAMKLSYFPLDPRSPMLHQPFGTVFGASCSCKICLLLYLFVSYSCSAHSAHSYLSSRVFVATSVRLCPQVATHGRALSLQAVREFLTWGACLPSPPVAFLGDPLFPGVKPFSLLGVPPFSKKDLSLPLMLYPVC